MQVYSLFIITLLGAFSLGATKYFGMGLLISKNPSDSAWIAQLIGAIMTIGPVLIFPWVIPLGKKFAKASLLGASLALSSSICISGYWIESTTFIWIQLFLIGLSMGVFGMIRTSLLPIIASDTKRSLTTLNAIISVLFIVGLISGLSFGRYIQVNNLFYGWIGIGGLFASPLLFIPLLGFKKPPRTSVSFSAIPSIAECLDLLQKNHLYVIGSTTIWGVASALTLAVTLNLEILHLADPVAATFMAAFATIGGALGNLISSRFQKDSEKHALFSSLALSLSLLLWVPLFSDFTIQNLSASNIYIIASALITFQGVTFGITTNLLDAKFLKICHQRNKEVEGATLQSTCISLSCFMIGSLGGFALLQNIISPLQQYYLLSLLSFGATFCIAILSLKCKSIQDLCLNLIHTLTNKLLKLRYQWNQINIPEFNQSKTGTLILPNHPAEMDPVMIETLFWKSHRPRPVMDSSFYQLPWLKPLAKAIGAFPMLDLSKQSGSYAQNEIKKTLQDIADALRNGEHVLFYPSGQLKRQAEERLGSNSGLYKIIQMVPDVNLLLVDNRGMWGSRFSTYPHDGHSPNLLQQIKSAAIDLCFNLFFFMPKRQLNLRVEKGSESLKQQKSPAELNRQLEQWYNTPKLDELKEVKTKFWHKNKTKTTEQTTQKEEKLITLSSEHQNVLECIAEYCNLNKNELKANSNLIDDLGLDSLARMELLAHLEQELSLNFPQPEKIRTISDLITEQKTMDSENTTKITWPTISKTPLRKIELPKSKHLGLAFLEQNDVLSSDTHLVADGDRKSLTSKEFRQCIYAITQFFNNDKSPIGICLPASSLAGASLLAASLAQRLAVPLNWTVGARAWKHAIEISEVQTIFTSRQFLNKANIPLDENQNITWLIWEDLLESLTLGEKLMIQHKALTQAEDWRNEFQLNDFNPNSPAVLLFTSGSESLPKGVPLSHNNLLSNLSSCIERMNLYCHDILMGFLPPFHAFGLSVTTLLPLLTGMKVVYSPNPTNTNSLKRHIKNWSPNLICGTPTFFKNLLHASKNKELESINTYISGAEACPESLKQELKQYGDHILVLEGYGMTEAGPVLCLQNPEHQTEGVGASLKDIDLLIVDPNSHETCESGKSGLILAKGPNFFNGYWKSDKNPFITIHNESWYNTGDLGRLNQNGDLILEGRLSRFIKIAGEMVSLPALEKVLLKELNAGEELDLVIIPDEKEGERPTLTLFSTVELDTKEANKTLREAGFSGLSRIHQCLKIDHIPTLGTGKTDFKQLKYMLEKDAA